MSKIQSIQENRRQNFAVLVHKFSNQEEAAKELAIKKTQVSNYSTGNRLMGEKLARKIEKNAQIPPGSLDADPENSPTNKFGWLSPNFEADTYGVADRESENYQFRSMTPSGRDPEVYVPNYQVWLGKCKEGEEERITGVRASVLEKHGLSSSDVVSIVVKDDAQGPRMVTGDSAVIALQFDKPLKNNAIYAVKLGDTITLRVVSIKANGDIKLACKNPDFAFNDELIPKNAIADLEIIGERIYSGGE